jgi:hypothetical protein
MSGRARRPIRRSGWAMVSAVALMIVGGLTPAVVDDAVAGAPAQCATRANDTASKLLACVDQNDLWSIMKDFQAIADANPGPDGHPSRNSGEPGYKASADYVAAAMAAAGYNVRIQTYQFDYYVYTALPVMAEVSPVSRTFTLDTEWGETKSVGASTAAIQPAGGIVLPPTATATSTSGCTPADFSAFMAGRIALVQRGGCNYGVKVQNAEAAGASGVVIFNEGNPGRTDLPFAGLLDAAGNEFVADIPVGTTTFAIGSDLEQQYQQAVQSGAALPVLSIDMHAIHRPDADDYNVIAESKGGDPNHVVVVDAHLDAIYGAGMLDNASGSATILNIAQQMKNVVPTNKLRFIWFGGEELGLLGSQYYVNNLPSSERSKIGYDLDADVTASPNYTIGVLDPAGPDLFSRQVETTFPNRVYKASTIARDRAVSYFDSIGKNHEFFAPNGTDAFNFNLVGIPASGLLTGQDCCKTQHEVDLFGGYTGNFEGNIPSTDGGCVDNPFRWCDNLSNNDPTVLTFMTKAFATMVLQMAFDTKVMSASNNTVTSKKLPIAEEDGRRSDAR